MPIFNKRSKDEGPNFSALLWHRINVIKRIALRAPSLISQAGGFFQAVNKVYSIYQREGILGVKVKLLSLISGNFSLNLGNDYALWQKYTTPSDQKLSLMRLAFSGTNSGPLISVLMPTYNSNTDWLEAAIQSVRNQVYQNWELCVADDASTDPSIRLLLEKFTKLDQRIKVVYRENNGHICAASNSALEIATGGWVALLDHDDILAEDALYWVAKAITENENIKLIYTDEDKINEIGVRSSPYFKCDWNVDLFYSHNLVTHLGVYSTALVKEVGGFRAGFEGAQDYDLALRFSEVIDVTAIYHIPRILYHWRMHTESTAYSSNAKPYAMIAGERALNDHFQRMKISATAKYEGFGYRVQYDLPEVLPKVSIIILTRNAVDLVRQCIESILRKTVYVNYEILLVDNGSDDERSINYFSELSANGQVRLIRDDRPFNFSALNNVAVKEAQGQVLVLLNNDIEVISPEWLSELVSIATQPGVGAVGAKLLYPNGRLQHAGVVLLGDLIAGHAHKGFLDAAPGYAGRAQLIQSFSAVTGACLAVSKVNYESVGGLNETELTVAFNDVDFCLRLKEAGLRNVWTPYARLFHHESATRGYEDTPEKQERFSRERRYMKDRWAHLLYSDPAYSPNLTLNLEDFSFSWPPRTRSVDARDEKALFGLNGNGLGLEIGPSHRPLAPKSRGFNVHILDHLDAAGLREKYEGHGVNIANIEEVDFVWSGQPFSELIGNTSCYDWIIASHVVEHVPDLVSFLQECETLLKPGGKLSLVVPDKRYCFDYFGQLSTTGNAIDAFDARHTKPSAGSVFDHHANAVFRNGVIAWGQDSDGAFSSVHQLHEARTLSDQARSKGDYIDVHCWRFIPESFVLILSDLKFLGLTSLSVAHQFPTEGCEFFVILSKTNEQPPTLNRLECMQRIFAASRERSGLI